MKEQTKNRFKKAGKITWFSLLLIILFTTVGGFIFGYRALIVDGASMEPIIKYRSLAIVKRYAPQKLKIGDALTYRTQGSNRFITHQLFEIKTPEGEIVAQFIHINDAQDKVDEDGGSYVLVPRYGEHVAAWYSGQEFTKDMIYITRGTNSTLDPFDGTNDSDKTYTQIYGKVLFSIPNVGNIVIFIQQNIVLVAITVIALLVLYNAVRKDFTKK